jgi:geranylgeranyl diphosphate synthase, type I
MNLSEAYAAYLPAVEAEMRSLLTAGDPAVARHYAMLQYHMGWLDTELAPASAPTGKRVRPMLCLLACAAAGGDPQRALPAAAGLELLHNFSLIHDDIEDDSLTRRHRPTVWALFGLPLACNAGDAMFSLAHLAFFRLPERAVPSERALQALQVFDETCLLLTEGQFLDMSFETRVDVTVDEYFAMIAGKTGALLGAAPAVGALVAGAPTEIVVAYQRFGRALGRAFQLQDDVLGIWGDEGLTGKSAASDILSKKKSLPVVYALASQVTGPEMQRRYAGPAFGGSDIPVVLDLLDRAGARSFAEKCIEDALQEARQTLASLEARLEPAAQLPLYELLAALVGRQS